MNSPDVTGARSAKRVFLFLQGHPSSFARKLADELERDGYKCLRINLCTGDALCWIGRRADNYRGRLKNWRAYLLDYVKRENVTDLLYYGDRKPYHMVAAEVAQDLGVNAFAYEFGYMRPDWITIEKGGMTAYSHFPDDPQLIRRIAEKQSPPDLQKKYPYSKNTEIFHEVTYNLATFFTPFLYPFYQPDRYYHLLVEYTSGIPGLFTEGLNHRKATQIIEDVLKAKHPFFLFPLQLQSDYQLRCNAPFTHQAEAIELVLRSFAEHAPGDNHLIVKQHPLDTGWEGWSRLARRLSQRYGIEERIHFIVGGDLDLLLRRARGCVQINSTVGLHALKAGCPVKALGTAIYDIEGLSDRGPLADFWTAPKRPEPQLVADFQRALVGTIQVKGNFFTEAGQAAAIPEMARMLIENRVNGTGAFVPRPPRLDAVRRH